MCVNSKEEGPQSYTNYDDMRSFLLRFDTIIGHNIQRFDVPVLERILGVDLSKHVIVDTLGLSWYLQPERKISHSLDSYGTEFLIFKPKVDDWENLPLEDYVHRCTEDVKINTRLWNDQHSYLSKLYPEESDRWRLIKYLSFKLYCARLQEQSKWRIDTEATEKALQSLETERATKIAQLTQSMPTVPLRVKKCKPKRFVKADGSLTKLGRDWLDLVTERNLPDDTEEIEIIVGQEAPNPGSHQQVKDWLFSLGWVPQTFEYKKTDGKEKAIPQINQKFGKGLDPGIVSLIENHPELEFLNGLSVLSHRISILENFLKTQEDGFVEARINGFTNTLRFQHVAPCVNLPKTDRLYAKEIRTALISRDGYEFLGADMIAIEDKLKQHYIFPFDPDYVKSMQLPDWDPHLLVAYNGGMLTQEEVDEYKIFKKTEGKEGSNKNSKVRDIAKNGGYAMQYGAFPPKLVKTLGVSLNVAKQLFEGYWSLNWAIKKVAETRTLKTVNNQQWVYNEVSGFWYSLRYEKDIFSTTVQGTASYVFDLWVRYVLNERPQLTAQFHDEIVIETLLEERKQVTQLLRNSIDKTNKALRLNVELDIGIQHGFNYGAIH